ncbi:MAG: transcriptional regulator [Microbacterium sp.]|jgi:diacylglycerol kinase family enzyme|nr:transcriptional regulator [Microbacterium sp.]
MERNAPHAAVVFHPGKADVERLRRIVAAHGGAAGWAPTRWYPTQAEDSGRGAAQDAVDDKPAVVLVAGGDGTVRAAAEVLQGTGVPVALIPAGTGNLLARELGITLGDVDAAVAVAFSGYERRIDVAVADLRGADREWSSHTFVVMAGIGLDADMAANTNALAKKHLGWLAYVTPIARSVLANRLFRVEYRIDGSRARSARAHTVIVGNCGTLAGNMLLIPRAAIDDGLLDVVMMRPRGRIGWAGIGSRLTLQGAARRSRFTRSIVARIPELHSLAYAQGRVFDASFEAPRVVQLDGDSFGQVDAARITVRPGALLIRVHQPQPEAALKSGTAARSLSDEAEDEGPEGQHHADDS